MLSRRHRVVGQVNPARSIIKSVSELQCEHFGDFLTIINYEMRARSAGDNEN